MIVDLTNQISNLGCFIHKLGNLEATIAEADTRLNISNLSTSKRNTFSILLLMIIILVNMILGVSEDLTYSLGLFNFLNVYIPGQILQTEGCIVLIYVEKKPQCFDQLIMMASAFLVVTKLAVDIG